MRTMFNFFESLFIPSNSEKGRYVYALVTTPYSHWYETSLVTTPCFRWPLSLFWYSECLCTLIYEIFLFMVIYTTLPMRTLCSSIFFWELGTSTRWLLHHVIWQKQLLSYRLYILVFFKRIWFRILGVCHYIIGKYFFVYFCFSSSEWLVGWLWHTEYDILVFWLSL